MKLFIVNMESKSSKTMRLAYVYSDGPVSCVWMDEPSCSVILFIYRQSNTHITKQKDNLFLSKDTSLILP